MSARDRILSAVRAGLDRRSPDAGLIAAEAAALLAEPQLIRPALAGPTLPEAFAIKVHAVGCTLDRIPDMADLPAALSRYLDGQGLAPSLALQPASELADLDWAGVRIHQRLAPDEPVALGLALWGVAESGSLVIHSGPDAPILTAFLPLHHVLVLRSSRILAHLEDYAAVQAEGGPAPRNAVLITGPSGTTDIEGSYVRGAHGPGYLHVILVEDTA
jgi:L-lactate dehydrogenase complex protein LldG